MITYRKTAAERQYENFLSAVREFGCNSSEGQFDRTLSWLVATHSEARRTGIQPGSSECERDVYRSSLPLNDQMGPQRGGVANSQRSFD
jgi:hypothetical protein